MCHDHHILSFSSAPLLPSCHSSHPAFRSICIMSVNSTCHYCLLKIQSKVKTLSYLTESEVHAHVVTKRTEARGANLVGNIISLSVPYWSLEPCLRIGVCSPYRLHVRLLWQFKSNFLISKHTKIFTDCRKSADVPIESWY